MKQFCLDVIEFLNSIYSDKYTFDCVLEQRRPEYLGCSTSIKLTVHYNKQFALTIAPSSMNHLYLLYCSEEYIEEREMYLWQKELVDMIEGG